MQKLLSLQASGESVEKAIAIHSTSLQTNYDFYSKYKTTVFWGHNLPKKNQRLNVHGTTGFYSEYLSDLKFIPDCSKRYLIDNKRKILHQLCIEGHITERTCNSLHSNDIYYWEFIRKIPFEYLYPKYYKKIITASCRLLNLDSLPQIYLEDNWAKVVSRIDSEHFRYSIYALESNGNVGRYYITGDIEKDYRLVRNFSTKASLSGNSAILLKTISHRIGDNTIVGYREHRRSVRPNRNHALKYLIDRNNVIIEPHNPVLGKVLNTIPSKLGDEQKTNIAFAICFRNFLNDNQSSLNL